MRKFLIVALCLYASIGFSVSKELNIFHRPFYIGPMVGYGSTTWDGLVPSADNQSIAMSLSTPIRVNEGGGVWGGFTGYEITSHFAIELTYMHYPGADIAFDPDSLFAYDQNGNTLLDTYTQSGSLSAKIMLTLPETSMRLFSTAGVARVVRKDYLNTIWLTSPTFGFGCNVNITDHIMGELGANYTSGYGESELNPVEDYVPFLYSIALKLAYRF